MKTRHPRKVPQPAQGTAPRNASKRVAPSLLALSSAAVLAVYAAGYVRTKAASERFSDDGPHRRPTGPPESRGGAMPEPPPGGPTLGRGVSAAVAAATADRAQMAPSAAPAEAHVEAIDVVHATTDARSPAPVSGAAAAPNVATNSTPAPKPAAASVDTVSAVPPVAFAPPPGSSPSPAVAPAPVVAKTKPAPAAAAPPAAATPAAATPAAPPSAAVPAPAAPPTTAAAPGAAVPLKDGTYTGWGTSRHGDIQATVVVQSGRIYAAEISKCLTRYSCSWIAMLPDQVVERQSPDVDNVSGATQSADAFYYAVVDALTKAR